MFVRKLFQSRSDIIGDVKKPNKPFERELPHRNNIT
jgi:hypothetical protein